MGHTCETFLLRAAQAHQRGPGAGVVILRRILLLGLVGAALLGGAGLVARRSRATAVPPPDAARVALGWRLLADRRLSRNDDLACLDCHIPALGYTDGKAVATADGLNTPTLYGLADRTTFGWFSPEVPTLEDFILRPLANPREMGPLTTATLDRLRADPALRAAYAAAFPGQAPAISWPTTAQALAAAIRAIAAPPRRPLSPAAARGQALFAELGCGGCHQGATRSSEAYLNTGVSADTSRNGGKARVPSLIGMAQTAPYFHDGSAATLAAVVGVYARGGTAPAPGVSRGISPFLITAAELSDLVAFLESR